MFTPHREIETSPDDTVIWRYLDLPRLVHLVATRSMFFCRLDKMGDEFEARLPRSLVVHRREANERVLAKMPVLIEHLKDLGVSDHAEYAAAACHGRAWTMLVRRRGVSTRTCLSALTTTTKNRPPYGVRVGTRPQG